MKFKGWGVRPRILTKEPEVISQGRGTTAVFPDRGPFTDGNLLDGYVVVVHY